jgi:hypothetical protein
MAKGAMADVVQENSQTNGAFFFLTNFVALPTDTRDGLRHEVHGTQNMMEARVVGAGIYEVAQAQLLDPAQALHVRMLEDIKNNFVRQRNKTVDWVVYDFLLVIWGCIRWQVANFKNSIKAIKNKTYAR